MVKTDCPKKVLRILIFKKFLTLLKGLLSRFRYCGLNFWNWIKGSGEYVLQEGTSSTWKANPESGCINLFMVYQTETITPYIHAMSNHVGGFIRIHSSILPFTQWGLLSSNAWSTLLQLMQKLRDNGAQLPKHQKLPVQIVVLPDIINYHDSAMWFCNHTPFCAHLIDEFHTVVKCCIWDVTLHVIQVQHL